RRTATRSRWGRTSRPTRSRSSALSSRPTTSRASWSRDTTPPPSPRRSACSRSRGTWAGSRCTASTEHRRRAPRAEPGTNAAPVRFPTLEAPNWVVAPIRPYSRSSKLFVVSSVVTAGRRILPRGWGDFGRQLAIWFGFALVYQVARGLADREPVVKAYSNGLWVVHIETQVTHRMYELTFEQFTEQRHWLAGIVFLDYWKSPVHFVGVALIFSFF